MSAKGIKENKCLEEIKIDVEALKAEIMLATLELAYPIGKEYVTQEDINPATILGFGTWERLKGRVLVGLDEEDEYFNEIGKEGGETTHKLTASEMPSHKHNTAMGDAKTDISTGGSHANNVISRYAYNNGDYYYTETNGRWTSSAGGDEAHNNTQPYKVVGYMWIRTA